MFDRITLHPTPPHVTTSVVLQANPKGPNHESWKHCKSTHILHHHRLSSCGYKNLKHAHASEQSHTHALMHICRDDAQIIPSLNPLTGSSIFQ